MERSPQGRGCSLRSSCRIDLTRNGGGHVGVSGCVFEAGSIEEAIDIMEDVIAKHLKDATL